MGERSTPLTPRQQRAYELGMRQGKGRGEPSRPLSPEQKRALETYRRRHGGRLPGQ